MKLVSYFRINFKKEKRRDWMVESASDAVKIKYCKFSDRQYKINIKIKVYRDWSTEDE